MTLPLTNGPTARIKLDDDHADAIIAELSEKYGVPSEFWETLADDFVEASEK